MVLADSPKVFPFLKIKPFLYYFKGLTGVHLDITIVFTITVNVWEQKQSLCGGMVLADSPKVFPVLKIKPPLPPPCLYYKRVKLNPFRNYHCFNYHSQCLRSKIKFVWGCGASRECGRISISNSKGLLYYFKGLSWAHLDIKIVLTIRANVWEQK